MNCTICGKRIVLIPSAAERARNYGGKPSDYSRLFIVHPACAEERNKRQVEEFIKRNQLQVSRERITYPVKT